MDGHSGIENRNVNSGDTQHFQLVLSFLVSPSGKRDFIIHASSNIAYGPEPHPLKFLEHIGFKLFNGTCPFFHDRCIWRHLATFEEYAPGFENMRATQEVHDAFKCFVDEIENLYRLIQTQGEILRRIGVNVPSLKVFATPPVVKVDATDIPIWVESIKFERLISIEKQLAETQQEIKELQEYLPLVYADGENLVAAVLKSLRLFNLKAELAMRGFTVDILAEIQDGTKKFGFEITGCPEAIKKDSNKLTQVLDFDRIKEHNEKTILLANTFKSLPIEERKNKEHFTQNVIDFLSKHPILLMTGYDLYKMVIGVLEKRKSQEEIIGILYETVGVLKYV